jgi:glycine/D-amino acid oxidase-like deaminating enzyme
VTVFEKVTLAGGGHLRRLSGPPGLRTTPWTKMLALALRASPQDVRRHAKHWSKPVNARQRQALPPSLYALTARPAAPTPPLDGDRRVSVAIVGAGFTGLSAALNLCERGVDVAVLEAHEPGWGASGRNGGQVNPGLKHDPDDVERRFGPDLGRRMIEFAWGAPNVVFDLITRHQITCEARQSGTLRAAYAGKAAREVRHSFEQGAKRGMPVALLERDEIGAATGTDRYLCALLDRRGGNLNPLAFARGLAQAAMQAGAKVYGATPARKVWRDGSAWSVLTPSGTLRAEKLVLATNGYTDDLWPLLRRTIVPVFSGIVATEPIPESLARAVFPARASLYEMGKVTVYYRLDAANRLLMGGRCRQCEATRPEHMQFLLRYTQRLWPQLKPFTFTHGWNGQLAVTMDQYPHIHEPAEGVLVCLGYNGRGVALSTAMGAELARRVLGGKSAEINMPITDLKSIPFQGLWRGAVAARTSLGRIRDYLGV